MSNDQTPDEGEEKRRRGRPKIGPAIPVRLSESDQMYVTSKGGSKCILAEGVRVAIGIARQTEPFLDVQQKTIIDATTIGKGSLAKGIEKAVQYYASNRALKDAGTFEPSLEDLALAKEIGNGSVTNGIRAALLVAQTLGPEAIQRMGNYGNSSKRK